jgi:dipeptidyl aminopeptidase/acylaminoacyl peptidase
MPLPTGASTESEPRWSPDGSKVVFVTGRDGATEIYVMKADGTGLTRVTDHPGDDFSPAWSPDGTQIAFASDRDGDAEIFVAKSDGTDVIQLTDNAWDDTNPDWVIPEPESKSTAEATEGSFNVLGTSTTTTQSLRDQYRRHGLAPALRRTVCRFPGVGAGWTG